MKETVEENEKDLENEKKMKSQINELKKERKKKRYKMGDEKFMRKERIEERDENESMKNMENEIDENERKKRKKDEIIVDVSLDTKKSDENSPIDEIKKVEKNNDKVVHNEKVWFDEKDDEKVKGEENGQETCIPKVKSVEVPKTTQKSPKIGLNFGKKGSFGTNLPLLPSPR